MVRIQLGSKFLNILIDSGATYSCIDQQFALGLGLRIEPLQRGEISNLFSVNSQRVDILGKVQVEINIADLRISYTFLAVKDLNTKILMGLDFMRCFKCTCDFVKGILTLENERSRRVEVPMIRKENYLGLARILSHVTIGSKKMMKVHIGTGNKKNNGEMMLKPLVKPPGGLSIGKLTQKCDRQKTATVMLLNNARHSISINKFTPIAYVVAGCNTNKNTNITNTDNTSVKIVCETSAVSLPGNNNRCP